ncbi:MAG: FMN-binding protein [Tissierellaceae bacterium]|nr:FMN-binding protein [Tissierellaceae bacterium]
MKNLKKILVLTLIAAVFLTACAKTTDEVTNDAEALFKAGTYTAEAAGFGGPVKVEVVFSDSKIESVTVKEHGETAGISDPAINDIPANIVEAQSLDVDAVTGATMTSKAIKYAVADAVKQAGGEDNALLDVDLDRVSNAEAYFEQAVEAIEKPVAVDGVIEVTSYDDLKRALGYYDYIVNPDTKEGKFVYVEGSAVEGNTVKLVNDITAEGDKDNPNNADGADKYDVVTGATILVTKNLTIDGNGNTIKGDGYPTFMFTGKDDEFGNDSIESTLRNITIDDGAYNAKIGGAVYVHGAATLNLEDSTISNSSAGAEKLFFNGGGAVYATSAKVKPEEGKAILNVTNSTFTGNTTANGGGAALMGLHADINVYNSKFTDNKSLSEMGVGGAIAIRGNSNLLIEDSEITGNEATIAGGGVYVFDGVSLFKGDGVLTNAGSAIIKNSTIKDNVAHNGADVTFGRFYPEGYEGDKERNGLDVSEGNTIGVSEDLTFTTIERTEIVK